MSEFECRNRHMMKSGEYECSICGAKVTYMDGLSSSQIAEMDRDADNMVDDDYEDYYDEEDEGEEDL